MSANEGAFHRGWKLFGGARVRYEHLKVETEGADVGQLVAVLE